MSEAITKALQQIADWNSHTTEFSVDYGSNGVRDFYRGIARAALSQAGQGGQGEAVDGFRGDDAALVRNITALIELSDDGALVPHGLGGHARALLSAAASRLAIHQHAAQPAPAPATVASADAEWIHHPFTPRKDEFDALYASLCERPITIHEIARRCWKAAQQTTPAVPASRTDQQIVNQTEDLAAWLMSWHRGQEPESPGFKFRDTKNTKAQGCWDAACHIQEMLTATDANNAADMVDDESAAPAVPAGWQLVPVKCTAAMKDVGMQFEYATVSDGRLLAQSLWNELLSAAPKPEHGGAA